MRWPIEERFHEGNDQVGMDYFMSIARGLLGIAI
jgi:hypothetical protein